jgi:hypothetical protein
VSDLTSLPPSRRHPPLSLASRLLSIPLSSTLIPPSFPSPSQSSPSLFSFFRTLPTSIDPINARGLVLPVVVLVALDAAVARTLPAVALAAVTTIAAPTVVLVRL